MLPVAVLLEVARAGTTSIYVKFAGSFAFLTLSTVIIFDLNAIERTLLAQTHRQLTLFASYARGTLLA